MRISAYSILLLLAGLLNISAVQANTPLLQSCSETVCSEVFRNKELSIATAVVWRSEGDILASHTFDLDSSAVLAHQDSAVSANYNDSTSDASAAPCPSGSCSASRVTTYETATDIITVTKTFTYFKGQLIDVTIQQTEKVKPTEMPG